MKRLKVLLVYPEVPETFWRLTHALRFFGKRAWSPPLGLLTVAAMLPSEYERRLCDLNVSSLADGQLAWADYAFLSAMDVQRESSRELIARCKRLGVKVVAGGPLFTNTPEDFADVDHLVLNEAELTLPPFLEDLRCGYAKRVYSSSEYARIVDSPVPSYELIDQSAYAALSIQSSRGCPHRCEFCNVTALLGRQPRTKDATQVVAELDNIYRLGWRGQVFFVDDNLMADKRYLKKDLLPQIIDWKVGKPGISFQTQITLNVANEPRIMELLYEAGFDRVFIGIETPEESSLRECKKNQNVGQDIPRQIRRLHRNGLQVQGGFIVGFDHDTPDIFRRQFELIQENGIVTAMVGILQAPPGTELYKRLDREGRLTGRFSGNITLGRTNVVTRMDPEMVATGYRTLLRELYKPSNYYARIKQFLEEYKGPQQRTRVTRELAIAVLRCLFWLGVVCKGRTHFWRLLWWAAAHKRGSVQELLFLAIVGYHCRRIQDDLSGDRDQREAGATASALAHV